MEKIIDKMMTDDFVRYATTDLNRPITEEECIIEEVIYNGFNPEINNCFHFCFLWWHTDFCLTKQFEIIQIVVGSMLKKASVLTSLPSCIYISLEVNCLKLIYRVLWSHKLRKRCHVLGGLSGLVPPWSYMGLPSHYHVDCDHIGLTLILHRTVRSSLCSTVNQGSLVLGLNCLRYNILTYICIYCSTCDNFYFFVEL